MTMVAHMPFCSPSFKLVAKGLVELHRLIKDRRDDSPEAESVRDALDLPLQSLNKTEKERAQWLSEDLYSVSEPSLATIQKEMNSQAQEQLNEVFEARQRQEWDRALALLRLWRDYISPALLSYLRGAIWLEVENPIIAAFFFEDASTRDPANANYRSLYLSALAGFDPDAAGNLARDVLSVAEKHAPLVVAQATDIRFKATRTATDAESAQLYRELIPILERNRARIEKDDGAASRAIAYAMTVGLLGLCHEFLGNAGAAVTCYSRGLQVKPNDHGLLVARGILQYGTSPSAIIDLERAVALGSPVVWPYLFLAYHYLATSRFDECRVMCETGLRMNGSETAKSQLEEWRAIAQAELGFPPDSVRAAFEAALRWNPSNDLARRNQDTFEVSLRVSQTRPHSTWERTSKAAVRQFGLAERRYSLAS